MKTTVFLAALFAIATCATVSVNASYIAYGGSVTIKELPQTEPPTSTTSNSTSNQMVLSQTSKSQLFEKKSTLVGTVPLSQAVTQEIVSEIATHIARATQWVPTSSIPKKYLVSLQIEIKIGTMDALANGQGRSLASINYETQTNNIQNPENALEGLKKEINSQLIKKNFAALIYQNSGYFTRFWNSMKNFLYYFKFW